MSLLLWGKKSKRIQRKQVWNRSFNHSTNHPTTTMSNETEIPHWYIWMKTMLFRIQRVSLQITKDFRKFILSNKGYIFKKNHHLILNTRKYSTIQTQIKAILLKLPIVSFNYRRDVLNLYWKHTSVSTVRRQFSKGQLLLCTWKP